MGLEGENRFDRFLIGGDYKKVLDKVDTPILFIPQNSTFSPPNKILYATDFDPDDLDIIRYLIKLTKRFEPEIIIAHIVVPTDSEVIGQEDMKKLKQKIRSGIRYKKISYDVLKGNDINQELTNLIKQVDPDWLVMLTQKRLSLLDKYLQHSYSRRMLSKTQLPLFVFHQEFQ